MISDLIVPVIRNLQGRIERDVIGVKAGRVSFFFNCQIQAVDEGKIWSPKRDCKNSMGQIWKKQIYKKKKKNKESFHPHE